MTQMQFVRPSATLEKKAEDGTNLPNVIKITNRALDETLEDGTKFEIPADKFELPQVDNEDDMAQICGGKDNILKVFNKMLFDDALAAGKTKIRVASSGSQDDIIAAGIAAAKNFTYVEETSLSASEAKNKVSELRNIAAKGDLSDAELAALVRQSLGIK